MIRSSLATAAADHPTKTFEALQQVVDDSTRDLRPCRQLQRAVRTFYLDSDPCDDRAMTKKVLSEIKLHVGQHPIAQVIREFKRLYKQEYCRYFLKRGEFDPSTAFEKLAA